MEQFVIKVMLIDVTKGEASDVIDSLGISFFSKDYKSTIGVQFGTLVMEYEDIIIKTVFWDVAQISKFKSYRHLYFKDAEGAVVFLNLDTSLEKISEIVQELRRLIGTTPIIVLGASGEAQAFLRDLNIDIVSSPNDLIETYRNRSRYMLEMSRARYLFGFRKGDPKKRRALRKRMKFSKPKHKIILKDMLRVLNIQVIRKEALIFRDDHYFSLNLKTGEVRVHSSIESNKVARICLVRQTPGISNTTLDSKSLDILAKACSIAWNELPNDVNLSINKYLKHGKVGKYIYPIDI